MAGREPIRIGDFNWLTPPIKIWGMTAIAAFGACAWCWWKTKSAAEPLSTNVAMLVTLITAPLGIIAFFQAAKRFVLWVTIGDQLTYATIFQHQTVAWNDVEVIAFTKEIKSASLPVVPMSVVVGVACLALIQVKNGPLLIGRVNRHEGEKLLKIMAEHPHLYQQTARDQSNPQDMMMSFMLAVMHNNLDNAESFFDLANVEAKLSKDAVGAVAVKLCDVLVQFLDAELDEIPNDNDVPSPYILGESLNRPVSPEATAVLGRIKMVRDTESDCWRFHADTIQMIWNEYL